MEAEESCSVEKRQAIKGPKKFIPKVAASGPPSSKKGALPEPLPQQQPVASSSSKQAVPRVSSPLSTPQNKGKGKEVPVIPKRRSMRILETRFANTCKNKGEDLGPKVMVTVDDDNDDGSDESGAPETEISTHKQESTHNTSGMDEDLDEDQYYSHDEDTYPDFDINLEEPDASDTPLELASDRGQHVDIELVVPTVEDTTGASSEAGFDFPAIVADVVLSLPAVQPPSPPNLGTSAMAADTSPPLLTIIPPTSPILDTSNMAVDTSPPLPAVLPPTSPILDTSDMAAGTSPPLPAVLSSTPPILGTSDMAAGTSPPLPTVLPLAEIVDNSHRNGDTFIAGTSRGHSSEKSMSWQDWKNSYTAFKALFDGGVTILRSIDELLPLCHKFNRYVAFQGALVYPKTVAILRKFIDKYESFMEASDITSSFSRCAAF
ncbi:unnamed protein product [Prunus armeniaca]